jgi:Ring finger domain
MQNPSHKFTFFALFVCFSLSSSLSTKKMASSSIPHVNFTVEEPMEFDPSIVRDEFQMHNAFTRPIMRNNTRPIRRIVLGVPEQQYTTPVRSLPEQWLANIGLRRPDPVGFAQRVAQLQASREEQTPVRPVLQRQNAMPLHATLPIVIVQPEEYSDVSSDDDDEDDVLRHALNFLQGALDTTLDEADLPQAAANPKDTYDHVLLPYHGPLTVDWQCGVCFNAEEGDFDEGEKANLVAHPSDCGHSFHEWCLNRALYEMPTCPLCRSSGAPLQMIAKPN